jgi:protein SCO1/2
MPLLVAALAASLSLGTARAHSQHAQHELQQAAAAKPGAVKVRYDDTQLTDADGRLQRVKSDVIGERLVVIDFVYTTCTTVCPVLSAMMSQVQSEVGARTASDVRLVTITVDPARDTPARLKEYGARHGAGPNWVWLTGPTGRVNEVLKGFGAYSPNFEDHPPLVLVGDPKSGQWTRFFGLTDPKQVAARVQELRATRTAGMAAGHKH